MKKIITSLILSFLCLIAFVSYNKVVAYENNLNCPTGEICETFNEETLVRKIALADSGGSGGDSTPDSIFGQISPPPGVSQLNQQSEGGIGIILFFSNLIKLISIVAGVWTMFNFILAGFTYITKSDNSGDIEKIGNKLTLSVIGLAIIVASYTIAAVIGLIVFGDSSYIINPQIPSAIIQI